ncbi:MAG TPA: hypothetical protein VG146_06670 [Verrucomicrobiae bacterium]|nr:hypothetical protein [Verrucomicrobiae bacterium]
MSIVPDNEFDLEKLFLPAWAQEAPSAIKYAKYEGEAQRRDEKGPRGPRRQGRPAGQHAGARPPGGDRRRRTDSEGRQGRPGGGPRPQAGRDAGFDARPGDRRPRREPPPPLPEIAVNIVPEEKGVESLARQIKMAGRAYPLFDIAQMILQKPERHTVVFEIRKNAQGQPLQPLFLCALDETLWLSEEEAIAHVLKKHFTTFYLPERTATEPPKGKYTFVAQCGMSGTILGPPNHHDYQNQLRKLHAERFSRMPFEAYKARVKIVRDEEVVKKWVEDQSWKTEYLCLNLPEPARLGSMEAVEKHFRETHKDNIIKQVERQSMAGTAARALRCDGLARLARSAWEDQRRFPLQIATVLSQQFAGHGLQFFKVNKTITHVSVARPHYLDLVLTPVSEGVQRIVEFINAQPKCTRRQLVEALAPAPAAAQPVPPPAPAENPTAPARSEPTPEQTAVISDLHWLIHQGHVIEFANGVLETAKKPIPKPPKSAPRQPAPASETGPSAPETVQARPAEPATLADAAPAASSGMPVESAPQPADEKPALEHQGGLTPPQSEEALPSNGLKTEHFEPSSTSEPSRKESIQAETEEPAAQTSPAPLGSHL